MATTAHHSKASVVATEMTVFKPTPNMARATVEQAGKKEMSTFGSGTAKSRQTHNLSLGQDVERLIRED